MIIEFFYFSHGGSFSFECLGSVIFFGFEGDPLTETAEVLSRGKRISTTWLESIALGLLVGETDGPTVVVVVIFGLFGSTPCPILVSVVSWVVFTPS